MRFMAWAIGSNVTGSDTNSFHLATQINSNVMQSPWTSGTDTLNAPISFTLEDSKQAVGTGRNFIRTIKGCVINSTTLTATQGEKVTQTIDYIGQNLIQSSGTTTAVTASSITPYLWSSASLTINGSVIQTPKEISLTINQNLEAPHYLDGTRDIATPFAQNRENLLSVTMDLDSDDAEGIYTDLFKGNAQFDAVFDLNQDTSTAGSQHAIFTLSGCKVLTMDVPSENEGATETTMEITAQKVIGSIFDRQSAYNPF